jgi:hypothetical protein
MSACGLFARFQSRNYLQLLCGAVALTRTLITANAAAAVCRRRCQLGLVGGFGGALGLPRDSF